MEKIIFHRYRIDLINEVTNLIPLVLVHTLSQVKLTLILFNSNITQSIKVRLYVYVKFIVIEAPFGNKCARFNKNEIDDYT